MLVSRAFCLRGHDIFTGFCTFLLVYTVVMCETFLTWYKPKPARKVKQFSHRKTMIEIFLKSPGIRLKIFQNVLTELASKNKL